MPADVKDIPDDCGLLRRVTPSQIVPDKNLGRRRLIVGGVSRSAAVGGRGVPADGRRLGLDLLAEAAPELLSRAPDMTAGLARGHGQVVEHTPQADNAFHAEIVGPKSGSVCATLRDAAEWIKKPSDV